MPTKPRTVRPIGSRKKKGSLSSLYKRSRGYKQLKVRMAVLVRDNFTCQKCRRFCSEEKLEADHIIPLSQGGEDTMKNQQALCLTCHAEKSKQERNRFSFPSLIK